MQNINHQLDSKRYTYGQPRKGWTKQICEIAQNKNIKKAIEKFNNLIVDKGIKFRSLCNPNEIIENIELYKSTLPTLEEYYNQNKQKLIPRDRFLLRYMQSKIFAQLKQFDKAYKYIEQAETIFSSLDSNHYNDINLSFTKAKYELMQALPLISKINNQSLEEILLSRTYVGKVSINEKEEIVNQLKKIYSSFRITEFTRLILYISGLNANEQDTFGIFFSSKFKNPNKPNSKAYYSRGNKIYILKDILEALKDEELQASICHELIHMIMHRLFQNDCNPYFFAGFRHGIHRSYEEECIRQTILKIVNVIFNKRDLKMAPFTGYFRSESKNDLFTIDCQKICFPRPWNEFSLEKLIENCYGSNGALRELCVKFPHKIFGQTQSEVPEEIMSFMKIAAALSFVYCGYPEVSYNREFIAHMASWSPLIPNYENSEFYQPLKSYLEKNVIPEMQMYIKEHPSFKSLKHIENSTHETPIVKSKNQSRKHIGLENFRLIKLTPFEVIKYHFEVIKYDFYPDIKTMLIILFNVCFIAMVAKACGLF